MDGDEGKGPTRRDKDQSIMVRMRTAAQERDREGAGGTLSGPPQASVSFFSFYRRGRMGPCFVYQETSPSAGTSLKYC